MSRQVLLVEPNYKNKYPPMGLMKLATYYRMLGDDVRFYKGDMKSLAADLICENLINNLKGICQDTCLKNTLWENYYPTLFSFIRHGKNAILEEDPIFTHEFVLDAVKEYRRKFQAKEYFTNPKFDVVGITTLFTFYWKITIDTINFAKQLCKDKANVLIGGIMSTILADQVEKETGIAPKRGVLSEPGVLDSGNDLIIDELPLDYSILEEIDYVYPASDAYFAYTTRGCINRCKFCAVPTLEPTYHDFIDLKQRIEQTNERFGPRKNLLLLDNNVLASKSYDRIIDEIKECGFGVGATYSLPNEYEIAIRNLREQYNERAYIRKVISIYKDIVNKLDNDQERAELYMRLEQNHCLHHYSAEKENILELDKYVRPLYEKTHKPSKRKRTVDFNQGIDSRLVTKANMDKLAEVNIYPLRIAFDQWALKDIYERSVHIAVSSGIKNLSNYLLYNFDDKPEELYYRLRLNVELCEELDASIYSFPMKYHPINDEKFCKNRNFIGKHWNRKFIRAIQAVLNSTKGKIGRGKEFFEEAFGRNVAEFVKILWMPETFIIFRRVYDADLRSRMAARYTTTTKHDCNLTAQWWAKFSALSEEKLAQAKAIIALNKFKDGDYECNDEEINDVLSYYKITRYDAIDT